MYDDLSRYDGLIQIYGRKLARMRAMKRTTGEGVGRRAVSELDDAVADVRLKVLMILGNNGGNLDEAQNVHAYIGRALANFVGDEVRKEKRRAALASMTLCEQIVADDIPQMTPESIDLQQLLLKFSDPVREFLIARATASVQGDVLITVSKRFGMSKVALWRLARREIASICALTGRDVIKNETDRPTTAIA